MFARPVDRGRAAQGMLWMHGHGKSYHLVVLTNRSNKASAAEAGGKEVSRGETGWQYTHRTLCRIERGIAARPVTPGGCRGLEEC